MQYLDKTLSVLLLIGAVLHSYGTISTYDAQSVIWVWSLGSSLAAALIAALNWLRPARLTDRALVLLTALASLAWAAIALCYGAAIQNLADPRVIWHAACGIGLAGFGFAALRPVK